MTHEERAQAVFDTWYDTKAGTELPKHERESLVTCITDALQATERAVWEQIEQHLDEKADEYFQDVNTQARLAIEAVDTWCHAQARVNP